MVLIQPAAKKKNRRFRFRKSSVTIFFGLWGLVVSAVSLFLLLRHTNDWSNAPSSRTQQQLRTLVVLTGNLRGGELAWDSLYRNLLDRGSNSDGAVVDLALLVGETPPQYQNATPFQRARYVWRVPEYDDWADALDAVAGNGSSHHHRSSSAAWREPFFRVWKPGSHNILMGPLNGTTGSGAIVFAYRWFLMREIRQHNLLNRYDRFIVTRADHYYLCRQDLELLDNDSIWIPSGSNYFGVCDRHMIVPSRYVMQALNILPPILLHPERYRDALTAVYSNTEQMLQRRLREEGLWSRVRRYRRTLFTCAAPGDATRFRRASSDATGEGVRVKYHLEYRTSKVQCRRAFLNSWWGRQWMKEWIEVPQMEET